MKTLILIWLKKKKIQGKQLSKMDSLEKMEVES